MNKLVFKYVTTKTSPGNIYKTDVIEISIKKKKYSLVFSIQENVSKGKLHARISRLRKIKINQDGNKEKEPVSKTECTEIYEYMSETLIKIEGQYLLKNEKRNIKEESSDIKKGISAFLESRNNIVIDLEKEMSLLPRKLTIDDINSIINMSNTGEIMRISLVKRLREFSTEWDRCISDDKIEKTFQELLKEYHEILPLIFPRIRNIKKIEYKIKSANYKDNSADILAEDIEYKTIIELKRPSTKLFTSIKRNNIVGLSKELISASIQLSLYDKRIQLNSEKLLDSFTYAILIIGDKKQFDSSEKKLSWKLYKDVIKHEMYTYDEISGLVKKIIENIN